MASDSPTRKKVTINLSLSRTARAFGPDESLWDIELKKIYRLIRQHLAVLDAKDQERLDRPVRETSLDRSSLEELPLLSIAIFGTYGSGKTSLLKTLVRESNREQKREDLNKPERGEMYALPLIEPNILAPDDHFLYAFLATALEEDLKHQDREERLASGSYRLSPVQQAFHKVSEYLQVIDPEKEAQESDPLGKSLERLDRHSSSFLLEQEMQRFISVLADELTSRRRTSVVLLAVDDADMSQENLIRILDTHRRYLQHPRLVPVFTFTSRLAEELLGVHFSEKLSTSKSQKMAESRQRGSSTTSLDLTEHLAYQYLVKLFPIRNRIRLGPAPARVQRGCFIPPRDDTQTDALESDGCPQGSHQVMGLLAGASKLLFGHSEWPLAPRVRLSLRPSTLRRQLQVVDAMVDAQVGGIPWTGPVEPEGNDNGDPGGAHGSTSEKDPHDTLTWVKVFTGASWSLLNVHRDVLREVNLHMEDLYSWTPRGLRRAILGGILTLDPGARETLIKRWRYRVESRRGQILSLLALVAFRPEMPGEEPSGDHPELTETSLQPPSEQPRWKLKVTQGALWFLSLWTGFYLPQLLSRGRELTESPKATGSQRIVGTGWSLRTGAVHAMREARETGEIFSTGMMRLQPEKVAAYLNKQVDKADEETDRARGLLHFHIWCFYGYSGGKPWSAVSLWRGLGLLGQILEDLETRRTSEGTLDPERLKHLILKHASWTRRPGLFKERGGENGDSTGGPEDEKAGGATADTKAASTNFQPWDLESDAAEGVAAELAGQLETWLKDYVGKKAGTLDPLLKRIAEKNPPDAESERRKSSWECCFLRRLHGEYLVGQLWPLLGGAYLSPAEKTSGRRRRLQGTGEWNAHRALSDWLKALQNYMDTGRRGADDDARWEGNEIYRFLSTCPLFEPWLEEEDKEGQEEKEREKEGLKWLEPFKELLVWDGPKPEPARHRVDFAWPSALAVALANSSAIGSQPFKVVLEDLPKTEAARGGSKPTTGKKGPKGTKKSSKTGRSGKSR